MAASFGSWYYYATLQRRPLALWGHEAADLMMHAPRVTVYRLAPLEQDKQAAGSPPAEESANAGERLQVGDQNLRVVERRDISGTRGLSHIRQGIIHDRSFDWNESLAEETPHWDYALEFTDGDRSTVVVFALAQHWMQAAAGDRGVSIRPISEEVKSFLAEQFAAPAGSS